jgi:hypothetical protein
VTPDDLNEECVQQLVNARLETRVAVVGSGPSSPYIAPIDALEKLLCSACGIAKSPKENFWAFCERAHNANPPEYFRVLRETYEDTPYWSARVYRHLLRMPFMGYATFSYDNQLPFEFRDRYPKTFADYFSVYPPRAGQTYSSPQEFLDPPPRLVALHGYCDPDNDIWEREAILRESDYNQHYIDNPARLFDWWRDMLLGIPCLFIGTSLKEPGLFKVVEYLLRQHNDRLLKMGHLHLVSATPDYKTGVYDAPETSLSVIEQVQYDRKDERYTGLVEVLSRISGLPVDPPSPRSPAPSRITATDTLEFT